MATVQILCPNGRRQNVKITPNTKILQILEEVCQKQKFLPAEDFKLIHGRKTLDVTLSVRYANLPNNAKLELVKSEKSREENEVVIALQLEDGSRLQHQFVPTMSLWDVLLYWENQPNSAHKNQLAKVDTSQDPPLQPVCIYMREEVIGEVALKETRLRTLGLTGGKAVIRLIHRPVEDAALAEIVAKLEKEKQRKSRLSSSSSGIQVPSNTDLPGGEQPNPVQATDSPTVPERLGQKDDLPAEKVVQDTAVTDSDNRTKSVDKAGDNVSSAKAESPAGKEPVPKVPKVSKPEEPVDQQKGDDSSEPMEVEQSESCDSVAKPMDVDEAVSNNTSKSESSGQAVTGRDTSAEARREAAERLRALNIPGVEIFTPDDFSDLSPEQQEVARRLAQAILPRIVQSRSDQRADSDTPKPIPKKQKQNVPFSDFKFPEATKGKKLYSNELSNVKPEDFKPCDRQTVVYSLEETSNSSTDTSEDLPDDFFDVTEADLRKLVSSQKQQMDLIENQPLLTSAMRQARIEDHYQKYDRVVVRIQFQDKNVLQGVFRPRETVFAIQKFVKQFIEDKSTPFYLYTSPPKFVLKDVSQTLIEAKLVPATVVYFGSEEKRDHYLSSAVLSEISSRLQADQIVADCLTEKSLEPSEDTDTAKSKSGSSSSTREPKAGPSSSGSSQAGGSKPVPKWFKAGKK